MSSDKASRSSPQTIGSVDDGRRASNATAAGDALSAWSSLIDDWWDQQSASLPDDLKRPLEATLDQSRAMVALALGLAAGNVRDSEDGGATGSPAEPASGLWQPIHESFKTCESSVLAGGVDPSETEEYATAAGAYFAEFGRLNVEVTRRVTERLAQLDADTGFVALHRLILEEAESAYLAHVSTDAFARQQAEFINALMRVAQSSRRELNAPAGEPDQA